MQKVAVSFMAESTHWTLLLTVSHVMPPHQAASNLRSLVTSFAILQFKLETGWGH